MCNRNCQNIPRGDITLDIVNGGENETASGYEVGQAVLTCMGVDDIQPDIYQVGDNLILPT